MFLGRKNVRTYTQMQTYLFESNGFLWVDVINLPILVPVK